MKEGCAQLARTSANYVPLVEPNVLFHRIALIPNQTQKLIWIFLLIPFVIFVAWIALKYFNEPVRAWLTRRYGIRMTPCPDTCSIPDHLSCTKNLHGRTSLTIQSVHLINL